MVGSLRSLGENRENGWQFSYSNVLRLRLSGFVFLGRIGEMVGRFRSLMFSFSIVSSLRAEGWQNRGTGNTNAWNLHCKLIESWRLAEQRDREY